MVEEIVFHLGDCKTGTTSVQSVLASGAWETDAGEVAYPTKFNHMALARSLTVADEKQFQTKRFETVRKALNNSDARYGVISAEHFEFVDPTLVKEAIEQHLPDYAHRVRLVAYVRPHGDRLVSTFGERSKKGLFGKSLTAMHDDLVQSRLLFYTPRFEKWRAVFGDRFTLRPFVRDQLYQGDVVKDFLHCLLNSGSFTVSRPSDQNNSLSVEDIAMMRALHQHLRALGGPIQQPASAFGWYMSDLLGSLPYPGGGTAPRLHKALANQVVDIYRADAAALDAGFFEGTPMTDALEATPGKAVNKRQSFQAKTHFDAATLRQFEAWAKLLHRMMQADPKHFAWAVRSPEQRAAKPPPIPAKAEAPVVSDAAINPLEGAAP